MEHLREYRAAADGKHRGIKAGRTVPCAGVGATADLAAAALADRFAVGLRSHAQSGPFAGMAGNWSGAGTVTLDDGSTERIRCRATYAVGAGGNGLQQTLTCASDSYKFNLVTNVMAQGAAVSGTWSETSRNINGTSRGAPAAAFFRSSRRRPDFPPTSTLTTRGNKQSVVIKAETQFRGANISMSRS